MLPDLLAPFDCDTRTRVVYGPGTLGRLGELVREYQGTRILLVTDKGLAAAGHVQRAIEILQHAGVEPTLFDDVRPNPTTDDVEHALQIAKAANINLIVGLGGGSSIDCAKGVNFLLTNGGKMEDYWGVGKATQPMLPMIAVPTTAGTGSEAQSFALISRADDHRKMACGDKKAACQVAILDPDLTASMPSSVASATGIDAVSHALETYVTKPRNVVSQLFSRQAWYLLCRAFPRSIDSRQQDAESRGMMLLGAYLAGAAIENSMLGIAHSLANPLTARYGLTHGLAVGVMLPHVIRYNSVVVGYHYAQLAQDANLCEARHPEAASKLANFVRELLEQCDCPVNLRQCNVRETDLPELARDAASQWTAQFNPRSVTPESLQELYQCAMRIDD